ncbi:MAG: hypothetical protein QXG00_02975 [Candidatus Woesearchaeota archaeon]
MKKLIFLLIITFFFTSCFSSAAQIETGSNIIINNEVNTNLYLFGENIETNNYINGDLIAIGGLANINSIISGDVTIISIESKLTKAVTRSVKIISGTTTVSKNIDGDLIIIAGSAIIEKDVEVKGDLIAITQIIDIQGKIDGGVRIISDQTILNNCTFLGNASIKSNDILLGDETKIYGDLNYSSSDHIYQIEKHVKGDTNFKQLKEKNYFSTLSNKIWYGLSLLIIGIILIMIFPNLVQNTAQKINNQLGKTLLWGIICLILIPIIAIIVFITIIGIPISIILFIIYIILLFFSPIFLSLLAGSAILPQNNKLNTMKRINQKIQKNKMILSLILGLFLYIVISSIPFLGDFVSLITLIIGLGAIILVNKELLQNLKNKNII